MSSGRVSSSASASGASSAGSGHSSSRSGGEGLVEQLPGPGRSVPSEVAPARGPARSRADRAAQVVQARGAPRAAAQQVAQRLPQRCRRPAPSSPTSSTRAAARRTAGRAGRARRASGRTGSRVRLVAHGHLRPRRPCARCRRRPWPAGGSGSRPSSANSTRGGGLARATARRRRAPSRSSTSASPGTVPTWREQVGGGHQLAGLDGRALGEQLGEARTGPARPAGPGRSRRSRGAAGAASDLDLPALLAASRTRPCRAGSGRRRAGRRPGRPASVLAGDRPARRSAEAATVSAAAMANRAQTPERGSTAGDSRTARVNRAMTSSRCSGHRRRPARASWRTSADLVGELERVVGADLGAEAVLERGDDPAAVGVVLGVGAGHQQQVQRQPQLVAADLDVALLEHVEQRDLDPLGQVGQLVDGEDAAVGARHQAVVDGLRVAEGAALGDLDRVDVADQVADAGVRGGQLLAVPVAAVQPADRQVVAELGDQPRGSARTTGCSGCVVELAAGDDRASTRRAARRACGSAGSCPGRARRAGPGRGRRAARARAAGSTVSSKPTMPGNAVPPERRTASRLARISSLTERGGGRRRAGRRGWSAREACW